MSNEAKSISSAETYLILKDTLGNFSCGSFEDRGIAKDYIVLAISFFITGIQKSDQDKIAQAFSYLREADKLTIPGINRCSKAALKKMAERNLFPTDIDLHEENHLKDCHALGVDENDIYFAVCVTTFQENGQINYFAEPGVFVGHLVDHLEDIFNRSGFGGLGTALKIIFPERIVEESGASKEEVFNTTRLHQLV